MISIILPTYNEVENAAEMIALIEAVALPSFEIIVVDDDSPDGTADFVRGLMTDKPYLRLVHRKNERGLTGAIQAGIDRAQGDIICWMDADCSQPPALLPELIRRIERENCDAAVASRFVADGADARDTSGKAMLYFHRFLSKALSIIAQLALKTDFRDWSSGYIALKRETILNHRLSGDYGEYFIHLIVAVLRAGGKIVEVPYTLTPRLRGESKTATGYFDFFRKGVKYLRTVYLARRPQERPTPRN